MSTTRIQKPWHEAAARLLQAVNVAPLEELRNPVEKVLGLNKEKILPVLFDHVNDLKQLSRLGYPGAIRSLVSIAWDISTFLATLSPHAEVPTGDVSTNAMAHNNSPKTQNDLPQTDQWSEINQAAVHLHRVVTEHYESCEVEFRKWQTELPDTTFSFPLEILLGRTKPPHPALELVADFCGGLIQRRFNSEVRAQMLLQTTGAWYWPVVVSAQHYKGNRKLKDCFPNPSLQPRWSHRLPLHRSD
jgi:hypothetical protein